MLSRTATAIRAFTWVMLGAAVLSGPGRVLAGTEDRVSKPAKDEAAAGKNATAEERIATLEETIRLLEARLKQVETRPGAAQQSDIAAITKPAASPLPTASPAPATTTAAVSPPADPPTTGNRLSFFDKIVFSGFADTYYGYNFNRPASRKNGLRNFDFNHNQFSLNLLELAMERAPDPLGFRVDFNFGDTAKFVHASEPGGSDLYQFLQQAYVTYKAPVGKGLSIDFGKFVTSMGAEVIESHANYNYSRSLLFAWAIPYYHFGTRISYPIGEKVSVAAHVVNGWNNVVENNSGKSVGFMVTLTPTKKLSIIENYMVGPEQTNSNADRRHVTDTVVTFSPNDRLSLMVNYDYGTDRVAGQRVHFQGFAGYARYAFTKWFAIAPRMEWFSDRQGFATGLAQTVKEATFTSEFKVRGSLIARAEYRRDWSDRPFFEKRIGSFSRSQTTATLGLIYVLGQEH